MRNGDFDFGLLAPHARIWHSSDGIELTVEGERQLVASFLPSVRQLSAVELRVYRHERGAILQYQLRVVANDGSVTLQPAFAAVTVENDQIVRLDEYLIRGPT
ncbi:MAG: hypothetical protein ACYDH6_10735 [Acidimicrobiales bacterium]